MSAVLLLLIFSALQQSSQTGIATGMLRGPDGKPAANVRVAAMALPDPTTGAGEGALVSLTQTDGAGRFRLENIVPGRYYIQAGLIDFPVYYPGSTTLAGATSVVVSAGAEVKGLDFTMSRGTGVRVSGRLPSGVRAPLIGMSGGSPTFTSNTTQLKPDGSFEFLRVTPGSYTLTALGSSGLPAMSIIVGDKDVDVGLPTGPSVRVSGVVGLGPSSPRPNGLKVILTSGSSAWASIESMVDKTGKFEFPNVPAGVYALRSTPGGAAPLATVNVADRDVNGIIVSALVDLTGKAALDGAALPALSPALMIEAKKQNGSILATAIRQDGTFRIPLSEGTYQIGFSKVPPGLTVRSISYGSIDLLKNPLVLDGSSEVREIQVKLAKP